ncbi:MAG: hypothetical protein AB1330_01275 [Bacillota bacterium]
MTAPISIEQYTRTFTSFSGADIVATFNSRVIGELQAISFTATREKAPIYTMGSPDPRSFSRGKRGVAGSLVFIVFNRNALLEEMLKEYKGLPLVRGYQTFAANVGKYADEILRGALSKQGYAGIATWDEIMTNLGYNRMIERQAPIEYVDQLPPFNISVHFANEYGQRAQLDIYGAEILNNGMAVSIDDVVTEQAMSFIARSYKEISPVAADATLA